LFFCLGVPHARTSDILEMVTGQTISLYLSCINAVLSLYVCAGQTISYLTTRNSITTCQTASILMSCPSKYVL
jgi:hypothetical protein